MKAFIRHRARDEENSAGFSRIELLAITAIIVLLAALFNPAWARTRLDDQSFQCLNNLRQLMGAMLMYTHDYNDLFPPNYDGGARPYYNWCPGEAGPGQADEFNSDILKDPTHSLLVPYIATNVALFHCPADRRFGRSTAKATLGQIVSNARSVSMSQAVGTDPSTGGKLAVTGHWLNGGTNTRNGPWSTYGKTSSILTPSPAMLWVLLDEAANSLNDASFGVTMVQNSFLDCPGIYYHLGYGIAFADGHSEIKSWTDRRLTTWPNGAPYTPTSSDVTWLQGRTSALK